MGSVPEFSASVHKRRMIRRWAENAPKMSRNRGNVSDLLTGKISATTPPPPLNAVGSRIGDENVPGAPPPQKKSWLRRCILSVYALLKVDGYYDSSVLSMSVMGFQKKKFGWGGW